MFNLFLIITITYKLKEKIKYNRADSYLGLPAKGTPTGDSYSTVEVLLKLDQQTRNFELLSKDYTIFLLNMFVGEIGDSFMMNKGIIHFFGGAEGVGAVL